MKTSQDETYLRMLGERLKEQDITGEILLADKAILLLDIRQKDVSKDVNVSFGPGNALREAAQLIAEQEGLPLHWLKQTIEHCFPERVQSEGATYPGLHIYVAPLGYLLTMLLLFGMQADDDVVYELTKTLGLSTATEMFSLVKAYLPEKNMPLHIQEKIEQMFAD